MVSLPRFLFLSSPPFQHEHLSASAYLLVSIIDKTYFGAVVPYKVLLSVPNHAQPRCRHAMMLPSSAHKEVTDMVKDAEEIGAFPDDAGGCTKQPKCVMEETYAGLYRH